MTFYSNTSTLPLYQTQLTTQESANQSKPKVNVSKLVKEACSIYITKGRINNTGSKLIATRNKCRRMAK